MHELYIKLLQYLCKKEIRKIASNYPHITREQLIRYHDLMAIECVNTNTLAEERLLGISINTAKMLEM